MVDLSKANVSNQSFSPEFREALLLVYLEKCFYCTSMIELEDMEVDHVIPESKLNDPLVLSQNGLPTTFDILGYENLVPSCSKCNGRKRDNPLTVGQVAIFLGQVANKVLLLKKEVNKQMKGRTLGVLLRSAANAIDKGRFSKDDLKRGLQEMGLLGFATVANPISIQITIAERSKSAIRFSRHALERLSERGFLLNEVEAALRTNTARVSRNTIYGHVVYELGTRDGLRIVYTIAEDVISVITVFRRKA